MTGANDQTIAPHKNRKAIASQAIVSLLLGLSGESLIKYHLDARSRESIEQ
ncbi:MAG: hypothetical protein HC895_14090 [Leptolyngbyaceae cyanobacterium SM1_3_5]|nr:hypothetical protein [Leptolyngbyaceae cyanobacterium SM1_3_5]